jgi:vancomycin resistance protein YoaR
VAVVAKDTLLRTAPSEGTSVLCGLPAGSRVAIESIENGWAKIPYWRQVGYVYVGELADLIPIYDAETALPGDVLGAFVTFYAETGSTLVANRVGNIQSACGYISRTIPPGERFSFDGIAAPYSYARGYAEAIAFFGGGTGTGMGGGVCQVSSTLYNALLPLGEGIEILMRRAHGPSGTTYLPHGVDAAVGNVNLNLIFRNRYDFPVRIEASARNGVLYTALLRE